MFFSFRHVLVLLLTIFFTPVCSSVVGALFFFFSAAYARLSIIPLSSYTGAHPLEARNKNDTTESRYSLLPTNIARHAFTDARSDIRRRKRQHLEGKKQPVKSPQALSFPVSVKVVRFALTCAQSSEVTQLKRHDDETSISARTKININGSSPPPSSPLPPASSHRSEQHQEKARQSTFSSPLSFVWPSISFFVVCLLGLYFDSRVVPALFCFQRKKPPFPFFFQ